MVKQEYIRKAHIITTMDGKVVFTGRVRLGKNEFASINAAKRESRKLQFPTLGNGLLRVAA